MNIHETISDQSHYDRCAEPHATEESGNAALRAFFNDVNALREKHRVPEVVMVAAVYVGDDEQPIAMMSSRGDARTWPELAACAYNEHCMPLIKMARKVESLANKSR